ncbi:MAG: DUF721 domain-containing protein [Sporichthyaceae bacterium]
MSAEHPPDSEPPAEPAQDTEPGVPAAAPPLDGVDLARAALTQAREEARRRSRGPRATAKSTAPRAPTAPGGEPISVASVLESLVEQRGWQVPTAVGSVMDRWPEIVGAEIAAQTQPVSYDDAVLVVQASSTAWATQLRLLAPQILRRLNTEIGHGSVRRLDVRAPSGPSWRHGKLRISDGRGPRDTYG